MNWVTAFTEYLQSQGIPIDGVSGTGASATIWYQSSATTQQKATAEAAKLTFVVPPTPDVAGFVNAINADVLVANQPLFFEIGGYLLAIFETDVNLGNFQDLQTHWNYAKTQFGATWLTGAVQTMILGYAAAHNIPIQ